MNFDFLKNVQLNVLPVKDVKVGASKIQRNPEGMTLRVFASGKVYPSQELSDKYNLEYVDKDSTDTANGMDVFRSDDWPMFPANAPERFIFIGIVPKTLPKVDLFGQVGYDESGAPKNSVLEQGGGSFGEQLVEMIQEVYGIEIPKGEFLDLEIKEDIKIKSGNDLYFVPKTVARGEKKGQVTVIRRENIDIMPLVPVTSSKAVDVYVQDTEEETFMEMQNSFSNIEEVEEEEISAV